MSKLPKGLLSIGKAAAALGVSIDTLRNWEKQGKLLPVKTDAGTRKYRKADINELIRNQGVKVRKISEQPAPRPTPPQAPQPFTHPRHELEALAPLLQEPVDPKEPSIRSLSSALDSMVDPNPQHKDDVIFNPAYQPIHRLAKTVNIYRTISRTAGTAALGMIALTMAVTTALTMGYLMAPGMTQRAVAKLPIPDPIHSIAEGLVMGFDAQHAAKLGFGRVSAPRDPLIAANIIRQAAAEKPDPNGDVLGRTLAPGVAVVQLNANTTVFGNVFADNIVNALTAGENLTLTGSLSNPILSAELPASILNTINSTSGELTLAAGSDISIASSTVGGTTTLTLSDSSTLSTVRGRGGCSACIVDGDVADDLTISSAGSVSGTAINSGLVAAVYGGTGLSTYGTGDLIYANSASTLINLAIGSTNQVLTVQGGVPVWTSATCQGCLVQAPTSNTTGAAGANTVAPTAANITGMTVLANSDSTGSPDIFRVQNAGGSTTLFKVDYAGDVTSNNTLYFGNGTTYSINSSAVATLLSIQNTPIGTVTPAAGNFSSIGATTTGTALFTTLDSTTGTTSLATGAGSSLTVGTATGTFALTSNALNVSTTGALSGVNSISNSGVYTQSGTSANTFTGTTTFSSSSTYAALFTGGNVGVGDTTPAYLFTVGNGDLFGVNSSGAIAAAAGLTSSGTITFSDVTDGGNAGIIHSSSTGVLSSSVIDLEGGANEITGGLHPSFGGTGQTTAPTNGQLLIGNSSTSNFSLNTITAGSNFSVTNGAGTITLTPSLTPTYTTVNGLTLTSNADGYSVAGGTTSRTMTVTGSNITLTGGGNTLTLTGNTTLNQNLTTASTPLFTGLSLSATTNQLVLGGDGGANTTTLSSTAPSTSRTYTIPDFGSDDTFVGLAATQTLTNKTLSADAINSATISSPTITASTITSTPIGASTPSTAVFTTLSSTGATTIGDGSTTVAVDTTSWDVTSAGAISGLSGLTFASGAYNFDQSASSGTLSTGTGNVSLNGDTTITAGKTLTLASGTGSFNQTFLSSTNNAAAQTLTYTNANTGASSITVNGLDIALTNATNGNSTNTLAGITFEAGSNNNSNVINGINFVSATGITNFLQTPSIDISSAGVITGATISGGSNTFSNIANSSLTNSSFTFQTGTGLSGGATVSLGGTLTLSNTGVLSVTGTSNQVNTSGSTGAVTLSLPQSIATTSTPSFAGSTLTGTLTMSGVTTDFTSASGEHIALVPNGSGKVGIGATSPGSLFSVGTSDSAGGFQVDSNGNIVKLNGITYSFPSAQAAGSAYVLQTNGSGTLSWVAQSAGTGCTPWSCLTDPIVTPTNTTGNLSLSMAAYTTTFTWGASTGASNLFNLTDTTGNTGTGYLNNITTAANSTLNPFHVGTGNGSLATDSITVLANGNVGIGNATPGAAFSVGTSDRLSIATTGLITLNPASSTPMANITNSQTPISAGGIGTWATLNTLPATRYQQVGTTYSGYVFVLGGVNSGDAAVSTVYSAQAKSDGTIGTWATLNTLPTVTYGHSVIAAYGYLFVTGGRNNAGTYLSTVYSATIKPDGTIGTWNTLNTLPTLNQNHALVAHNGYLFLIGGHNGSATVSTVYSAQINGNGTIETWQTLNTLPQVLRWHGAVVYNNNLFIFGGENGAAVSTVYAAPIKSNGTIGTWATLNTLPQPLYQISPVVSNGYLYITGGATTGATAVSTVYSTQLKSDGTIGTWATLNTLPAVVHGGTTVAANGYLLSIGGFNGSAGVSTVYSTPLGGTALATNTSSSWSNGNLLDLWNNSSSKLAIDYAGNLTTTGSLTLANSNQFQSTVNAQGAGTTGTYQTLNSLPAISGFHSSVVSNGYLFVTGGLNTSYLSTVYSAKVNADGTLGSWQTLNTLPGLMAYHSASTYNGYLFITGGERTAATLSTVYSAKINSDGTIGSWNTLNTLPAVNATHSSATYNGYLFVTGGHNGSATVSTVYSAQINGNGTIGTWATLNTLAQILNYHSTIAVNGYLFVVGGAGGLNISSVYSAPIKADGTIGSWATLQTLPTNNQQGSAVAYNGYIYLTGGNDGSTVSTVYSTKINNDGTIGRWATLNTLPAVVRAHSAVVANGYLITTGGHNGSAYVSTVYSTPLGSNALTYTTSLPQTNGNILDFWNNNTSIGGIDYSGRFLADAGLQINQTSTTPGANFTSSQTGVNAGGIGSWQTVTNLPQALYVHATVTYNGYIFVTGGYDLSGYKSTVYSAKVNADGTISAWTPLNTLPAVRAFHSAVAVNGYLFVIGGETVSTVYSAKINSDGTIGSWSTLNTLPLTLWSLSTTTYNGYIFVTGGVNGASTIVSTVYSAQVNGNGTIGTWTTLNTLPVLLRQHATVAYNGYLYVTGGTTGTIVSTVYSTPIRSDGTIGTWATLNTLPQTLYYHSAVVYNGYLIITGGQGSSNNSSVYSTQLKGDGTIGTWATLNTLPQLMYGHSAVVSNGYLITTAGLISGVIATSSVYSTPLQSTSFAFNTTNQFTNGNILDIWNATTSKLAVDYAGNITTQGSVTGTSLASTNVGIGAGSTGTYQTLNPLPAAITQHQATVYNNYLYLVGGITSGGASVSTVYYTQIKSDGTIGAWSSTTIPAIRYGPAVTAYNGYLFVMGGWSTLATSTVYSAKLNSDGSLGSWNTLNTLPATTKAAMTAAYNGYIFVAGGYNGSTLSTVYSAQVNGNGTIGTWNTLNTLPSILDTSTMTTTNGYLFVVGGANGSTAVSTVYSAPIKADGTIGTWATLNTLPQILQFAVAGNYNGYLYVFGGCNTACSSGSDIKSTVYSAKINTDGTIGSWASLNTLPYTIAAHSMVISSGYAFVVAGYANGAYASTVYSTPLQSNALAFQSINTFNAGNLLDVWNNGAQVANIDYSGKLNTNVGIQLNQLANSAPSANFTQSLQGLTAGSTGTYQTLTNLPQTDYGQAMATYNGFVYVLGGYNGSVNISTVYAAKVNADGTISAWSSLNTLPAINQLAGAAQAHNGYLYIAGGHTSGAASISTVYSAKINGDGTIGSWNALNTLPALRWGHGFTIAQGYMFILGGSPDAGTTPLSTVYSAQINGNGTIGTWQTLNTLPAIVEGAAVVADKGYIFQTGGSSTVAAAQAVSTVYSAAIRADGTIGTWATLNTLPVALFGHSAFVYNGYLYVSNGHAASNTVLSTVYSAKINSDGTIGQWALLNNSPLAARFTSSVVVNGYMILVGGQLQSSSAVSTVYSTPLQSDAFAFNTTNQFTAGNLLDVWNNGTQKFSVDYAGNIVAGGVTTAGLTSGVQGIQAGGLGTWQTMTNLPYAAHSLRSAIWNGYIFVSGGSGTSVVYSAKVNADGSVGAWTSLNTLPQTLQSHGMVSANGYLFVVGGYTGAATVSTVYSAKINADGTIGSWNTLNTLPAVVGHQVVTTYNGYLYSYAGTSNNAANGSVSTVYTAQINGNGTIGTWQTLTTLPVLTHDLGGFAYNGYLYSGGGSNSSGTALSTLYAAPIRTDGTIGTWATLNTLPDAVAGATFSVGNGYFYYLGGIASNTSTAYSAKLNTDGTIGSWATLNTLPASICCKTSVVTNGYVYVLGGLGGAAVSTVYGAPIQSDSFALNTTNTQTAGNLVDVVNNGQSVASIDYQGRINSVLGVQINNTSTTPAANFTQSLSGIGPGAIGSWQTLSSLPQVLYTNNAISYNGYIITTGGYNGGSKSTVYSAKVNADGTIGAWTSLNTLPALLSSHSTAVSNGYLFVTGGTTGSAVSTVYSAKINSDGTISTWNTLNTLPVVLVDHTAVVSNDYLFILGGTVGAAVSTVYSAKINSNGTIGTWQTLNTMPALLTQHSAAVYNNFIYVTGGDTVSTVYGVAVRPDGTIGTWQTLTALPITLRQHDSFTYNGYLYVSGGYNGTYRSTIFSAKIAADGTLSSWATTATLPVTLAFHSSVVSNGYFFAVGGFDGNNTVSTVYSTSLQSDAFAFNTVNALTSGNLIDVWNNGQSKISVDYAGNLGTAGSLTLASTQTPTANIISQAAAIGAGGSGNWKTLANLPQPLTKHGVTSYNGYVFSVGGSTNSATVSTVYSAKVNADGTLGSWNTLTNLPVVMYDNPTVVYGSYMFVTGGCSDVSCNTVLSTVYSAKINGDGTIGSWNTLNTLPAIVRGHTTVAANNYLFSLGGCNSTCINANIFSTVYSAPINGNGTIGTWQTLNTLPATMEGPSAVSYNNFLYVVGGWNNSSGRLSTVYSAQIKADGTIGTWSTLNTLLQTAEFPAVAVANGYLYSMGGYNGNSTSTAFSAALRADGTIGSWVTLSTLPQILYGRALTISNGFAFYIGGYNSGATANAQSTVYSTPLQSNALALNIGSSGSLTNGNILDAWNSNTAVFSVDYKGAVNTSAGIQINQASANPTANMISSLNGIAAGAIGSWNSVSVMPGTAIYDHQMVSYNNYVYILGGYTGAAGLSTVYYAKVNSDGTVGGWNSATAMPATKYSFAATAYNGYMYVAGGRDNYSNVYSAKVNSDGSLGSWNTLNTLPANRVDLPIVAHNGYLYAIAGHDAAVSTTSTVYYAQINGNGTIGTWSSTSTLLVHGHNAVAYNGYLYVMGGYSGAYVSTVYYAKQNADGTLGTWTATTNMPTSGVATTAGVYKGYIIVTGGDRDGGNANSTVFSGKINADGTISAWTYSTNLPSTNNHHGGAISDNGYLLISGGRPSVGSGTLTGVYSTPLQSSAFAWNTTNIQTNGNLMDIWNGAGTSVAAVDYTGRFLTNTGIQLNNGSTPQANLVSTVNGVTAGSTGSYQTLGNLPVAVDYNYMITYNNYLIFTGGIVTGGSATAATYFARSNADGTLSSWNTTTALPATTYGHGVATNRGYMFVVGGYSGGVLSTVYSAKINDNGTIGSWNTLNTLPATRGDLAVTAYNGYLYVVGGTADGNISGGVSTVYGAQINGNGTIGSWQTLNTLPSVTTNPSATTYNGYIFVSGGVNAGSTTLSTVYSAPLKADGTLGSWATLNTLPTVVRIHFSVVTNGYLLVVGGYTGSYISTVYSAQILPSGTIGTWATLNTLPTVNSIFGAGVSNGYLYIAGGFNGSVQLSTVYSVALQSTALASNTSSTFTAGNLMDFWNQGQSKFSVDYNGNLTTGGVTTANINSNVQGIAAGGIGTWQTVTNLPGVNSGLAVAGYNGYIFVVGGTNALNVAVSTVYSAKVNADGSLGAWNTLNTLPALLETSAVALNGYLFAIGGNTSAAVAVSTVYSAKINSDGTIGSWNTLNTLPALTRAGSATGAGQYIFFGGGLSGPLSTLYSAQVNGNGTIGSWQTLNTLPTVTRNHNLVTNGSYLFLVGGNTSVALSTVYSAPIKSDGTIGTWQTLNTLPAVNYTLSSVVANGYLYVLGGYSGSVAYSTVYSAKINTDGTIGTWATLNTLPAINGRLNTVAVNGYLFSLGGAPDNAVTPVSTVYSTPLQSNALAINATNGMTNGNLLDVQNNGSSKFAIDYNGNVQASGFTFNPASTTPAAQFASALQGVTAGSTGTYQTLANLPQVRRAHGSTTYNGYLYMLGGCNAACSGAGIYSTAYASKLSADGTIGPWIALTNLPAVNYGLSAVAYGGYLFVTGGNDGAATLSTVYSAKIASDGTIGSWATLNTLAATRHAHGSVIVNNYLFVLGGANAGALSTVYSAPILADGRIGTWATLNTLAAVNYGLSATTYNNFIYITGGHNDTVYLSTVYSAAVKADGTIGTWQTLTVLPQLIGYHGGTIANGYLYVLGGINAASLSTVYSAKIASDGTIGSWATLNTIPALTDYLGVASDGKFIYVTGGWDQTIARSTSYSAPLQSTAFAFNTVNNMTNGTLLDVWNGGISKASVDYAGNLSIAGQYTSNVVPSQDGHIGTWQTLNTLPAVNRSAGWVTWGGYIFEVGGHNGSSRVSTVYSAKVNSDGTIGPWSTLNTLPAVNSGAGVAAANGYLFIFGGSTGSVVSTAYSAQIKPDGTIGTWATLATMPTLRVSYGYTTYGDYFYVVGGSTDDSVALSTVYSVQMKTDGTLGTWQTLTVLPAVNILSSATAANGYLFSAGGCSAIACGIIYSTIYSAPIKADGTIGSWATLTAMPVVLQDFTLNTYNGYIYAFGGSTGSVVSTIYTAAIKTDGTIGSWATLSTLPAVRYQVGSVIYNGYAFILGGSTGSAVSTVYSTSLTTSRAFVFNTLNTYPEGTSLGGSASLFTLQNNGDARFTLDAQGNGRFLGNLYASGAVLGTPGQVGDLAENVPVADMSIEAADVVATGGPSGLVKSSRAYDPGLVGVISTQPSLLFSPETPNSRAVALAGRVPVKVSLEGGAINAGDYLTSSSQPGIAMKATRPGVVVGQALEEARDGRVLAFIQVGFVDPSQMLTQLSVDTAGNLIVPKMQVGQLLLGDEEALASADENALTDVVALLQNATQHQASAAAQIASAHATVYGLQNAQVLGLETTVASQSAQIADLRTRLELLAQPTATPSEAPFEASASAAPTIADLNITELFSTFQLAAVDATMSGTFTVLGDSTLGNTTIAGSLSVASASGGLALSGSGITLPDTLFFDADKVDFFNGLVTIDTNGSLTAQTVSTREVTTNALIVDSAGQTIGSGKITAGSASVVVEAPALTEHSKVFVTPMGNLDKPLAVINARSGESFEVVLPSAVGTDVEFKWWIIEAQ